MASEDWTPDQTETLKRLWTTTKLTAAQIGATFDPPRTEAAVLHKGKRIALPSRNQSEDWSDKQVALLRSLWDEGLCAAEIGTRLSRTREAINKKARSIPLQKRNYSIFSPEQDAVLRREWATGAQIQDIMAMLNDVPGRLITETQVIRGRASNLNLSRVRMNLFSAEQDAVIRDGWPSGRDTLAILADVQALPGSDCLTVKALRSRVRKLGLHRSREYIAALARAAVERAKIAATARPKGRGNTLFSVEQDALIRKEWQAGLSARIILAKVNAIPGRVCTSLENIQNRAIALRVRRPDTFRTYTPDAVRLKREAAGAVPRQRSAPTIGVPLHQLIRHAREVGLVEGRCLDPVAVSKAWQRLDKTHPGFHVVTVSRGFR